MGKGCLEEEIPVMSSGQAPVSHQGLWTAQEILAKVSPSCPISQANIWEPHGPRKYLFPKSVNDRLQRGWWNVNLLGCYSELSRKHRHEEPAEMESSADELCSSGGKQMNKQNPKQTEKSPPKPKQNPRWGEWAVDIRQGFKFMGNSRCSKNLCFDDITRAAGWK